MPQKYVSCFQSLQNAAGQPVLSSYLREMEPVTFETEVLIDGIQRLSWIVCRQLDTSSSYLRRGVTTPEKMPPEDWVIGKPVGMDVGGSNLL